MLTAGPGRSLSQELPAQTVPEAREPLLCSQPDLSPGLPAAPACLPGKFMSNELCVLPSGPQVAPPPLSCDHPALYQPGPSSSPDHDLPSTLSGSPEPTGGGGRSHSTHRCPHKVRTLSAESSMSKGTLPPSDSQWGCPGGALGVYRGRLFSEGDTLRGRLAPSSIFLPHTSHRHLLRAGQAQTRG